MPGPVRIDVGISLRDERDCQACLGIGDLYPNFFLTKAPIFISFSPVFSPGSAFFIIIFSCRGYRTPIFLLSRLN